MNRKKFPSQDLVKSSAKSRKLTHNSSDANEDTEPLAVPHLTDVLADAVHSHPAQQPRSGPSDQEQPESTSALQQDDLRMTGQSSPINDFDGADDMYPETDANPTAGDTTSELGRNLPQNSASAPSMSHSLHAHVGAAGPSGASGKRHVHKASGYEWEKEEDAPGYSWKNRKAREEQARALEQIIDKDKIIGRLYGDIGLEDFDEKD